MPLDQLHEHEKTEMSFFDHIEELRRHILRSVGAIVGVGVLFFLNKDFVFNTLLFGPRNPDFITYRAICAFSRAVGAGDSMCFSPTPFTILSRQLGEILMQHMMVSFWLGLICAFPFVLWEFWKFIRPGLLPAEQRTIRGVVFICSSLFFLGVCFGYFILAPFSISFLAGYTVEGAEVAPTLDSYVNYMTMFTIPTGLIFEMPIVAYFLAKLGVIGQQFMRAYRRHAIVVIVIVAAIITPPDVASQIIVVIPLLTLYEVSIMVVGRVQRQREKKLAASGYSNDVINPE
ncbi:MAG: twin-arginine translocase subunit TatC [Saprospiraceae bacterium]